MTDHTAMYVHREADAFGIYKHEHRPIPRCPEIGLNKNAKLLNLLKEARTLNFDGSLLIGHCKTDSSVIVFREVHCMKNT